MGKIMQVLQTRTPILNLLNTKYIIYNPSAPPFVNANAYGNCWFIKDIQYVPSANEEITSLGKVNLRSTVIVRQQYQSKIPAFRYDSTASIQLTSCLPNQLTYKTKTATPQFAVF